MQGQGFCNTVGSWDGSAWVPLGGNIQLEAMHLEVYSPIGQAPSLYAVHRDSSHAMHHNSRWDATQWTTIGTAQGRFNATAVYDDGTGSALYIGGSFSSIGAVPSMNLARWNGHQWQAVGGGAGPADRRVESLLVHDDGAGSALYIGGNFYTAGGVASPGVARWDGVWSSVGGGIPLRNQLGIVALQAFDGAIYAGGRAGVGNDSALFRWRADHWEDLTAAGPGAVLAMEAWDDGRGESLWLGGTFLTLGGAGGARSALLARMESCALGCYANCDSSTIEPVLNIDDVTCFINRFAHAATLPHAQQVEHYANCDGSTGAPALTIDDFTCFLRAFAVACP